MVVQSVRLDGPALPRKLKTARLRVVQFVWVSRQLPRRAILRNVNSRPNETAGPLVAPSASPSFALTLNQLAQSTKGLLVYSISSSLSLCSARCHTKATFWGPDCGGTSARVISNRALESSSSAAPSRPSLQTPKSRVDPREARLARESVPIPASDHESSSSSLMLERNTQATHTSRWP